MRKSASCFIFHFALMLVVTLGVPSIASAQLNDPCGCNAGLGKRVFLAKMTSQYKFSFLKQVDEKQYLEIRKTAIATPT